MNTWGWILVAVAVVVAVVLLAALLRIKRRRSHLKDRFGPEYYRAVSSSGTGGGERRLNEVEREHGDLELRPLPQAARDRYLEEWRQVESRFVSDPREAARSAERLIERALEEQGYPADDDADRRVGLVSVDHPDIAERYRHGHAMLEHVDGGESTENLRKALLDFRAVLEDVLQTDRAAA
jgi:hypothetical protein